MRNCPLSEGQVTVAIMQHFAGPARLGSACLLLLGGGFLACVGYDEGYWLVWAMMGVLGLLGGKSGGLGLLGLV